MKLSDPDCIPNFITSFFTELYFYFQAHFPKMLKYREHSMIDIYSCRLSCHVNLEGMDFIASKAQKGFSQSKPMKKWSKRLTPINHTFLTMEQRTKLARDG